jgi:hypothetical protein
MPPPTSGPPPAPPAATAGTSEAERGTAILSLGILAFRWVSLAWLAVLALTAGELRRPALAVAAIVVLAAWTAWLTLSRRAGRRTGATRAVLAVDLGLAPP